MTMIVLESDRILNDARREERLRSQQLLVAAQAYYDGDMDEQEFAGFVCRYGHAAVSRRILMHEIRNAQKGLEN